MNNLTYKNNNKNHIRVCAIFTLAFGVISAVLTGEMMFSLALDMSEHMLIAFVAIGVLLDCFKSYIPSLYFNLKKVSKWTPLPFLALMLAIMFLSFSASVNSLERGIDASLKNTTESLVAKEKISLLKAELEAERNLHAKQISINHISKADITAVRIKALNKDIATLLSQASQPTDSFLSKYKNYIAMVLAAALEISCCATVIAMHVLKKANIGSAQNVAGQAGTSTELTLGRTLESVGGTSETVGVTMYACESTETNRDKNIVPVKLHEPEVFGEKTEDQIIQDLKQALSAKVVLPNQRSVYQFCKGSLTKRQVPMYLQKLVDMGCLVAVEGNRFKLA